MCGWSIQQPQLFNPVVRCTAGTVLPHPSHVRERAPPPAPADGGTQEESEGPRDDSSDHHSSGGGVAGLVAEQGVVEGGVEGGVEEGVEACAAFLAALTAATAGLAPWRPTQQYPILFLHALCCREEQPLAVIVRVVHTISYLLPI